MPSREAHEIAAEVVGDVKKRGKPSEKPPNRSLDGLDTIDVTNAELTRERRRIKRATDLDNARAHAGAPENPWVDNHWRAINHLKAAIQAIASDCDETYRLLFRYHALAGRLINAEAEERAGLIDELIATWEGISSND